MERPPRGRDPTTSLFELQLGQKKHDEQFHRDIFFLSHQERFKHVAFHFGKYSARIARILKQSEQGKPIDNLAVQRTLIDSSLMILNAAEIFNLDLAKELAPKLGPQSEKASVKETLGLLSKAYSGGYPWLVSQDSKLLVSGLLLELTDRAGIIHKACDSLDHMEGLSRETVTSALLDLFVVVMLAGQAMEIDYETSIPLRWREIERTKVL